MSESSEDRDRLSHHMAQQHHAEWMRDISRWRVDHQKALAILSKLVGTIHDFESETEAHAAAIRDHHLAIMQHNRAFERDDVTDEVQKKLEARHRETQKLHEEVNERHDELQQQHEELMNDIGVLFDVLQWDSIEVKGG